jgi:hypothetical protein
MRIAVADLLERGMAWLAGKLKAHASQTVTYRRGAASLELQAVVGRRELAQVDEGGFQTAWHATDFVFTAEDLDFGDGPVEPEIGDTITVLLGGLFVTCEVMDEAGGKHFEYSDPTRQIVRVHTKQREAV